MIVKWAGNKKANRSVEVPVVSADIYPTILSMAGLPLRPEQHVDGVSLKPLLKGKKTLDREAIYFHYPHYHHIKTMGPAGAVRMGDYKLVERYETMEVELYNLKKDIGESHDLSEQMPEKTAEMKAMLHQWREGTGSEMTTVNPDYQSKKQ